MPSYHSWYWLSFLYINDVISLSYKKFKKKGIASKFCNMCIHFAAPNYMLGGDIQPREFVSPKIEETGPIANGYNYSEEQIQQVPETEKIIEENYPVQSNGSLHGAVNSVPDRFSSPVEESVVEPQKHTYASIVCELLLFHGYSWMDKFITHYILILSKVAGC